MSPGQDDDFKLRTDAENIFVGSIYLLDLSSETDWMPSLHIAHPQANLLRINTVIANDHQTWCYSSRELAYSINFTVAALFSKCNWILTAVNGVDNARTAKYQTLSGALALRSLIWRMCIVIAISVYAVIIRGYLGSQELHIKWN